MEIGIVWILFVLAVLISIFGRGLTKKKDTVSAIFGMLAVVFLIVAVGFVQVKPVAITTPGGVVSEEEPTGVAQPIVTFTAYLIESLSNSPTAITDGTLDIYNKADDPADATVDPIATVYRTANGKFSASSPGINTNTLYRVVYGGNGSWYTKDFGVISFNGQGAFDDNTNAFVWRPSDQNVDWKINKQGSITDFLDETTASNLNGQSNSSSAYPSNEIGCSVTCSADGVILYNESSGDGSYYLDLTFATGGSNAYVEGYSICFLYESGAEPEGNEYSSIVLSSQSGSGFDIIGANGGSDDLVGVFSQAGCVNLGDIKSGYSHKWRLTFTVTEANLDTSDDYTIVADDLGKINGKTIDANTGVTKDSVDIDSYSS